MLAGKLPTGTVDRSGDGGRRDGLAHTERPERPTNTGRTERPERPTNTGRTERPERPTNTGRTERTERPTNTGRTGGGHDRRPGDGGRPAAGRSGELAAENRRLKRLLASERTERRAVIDRYERLLTEQTGANEASCEGGSVGERAVARVRRLLTRLRC